jgi:hypothetical protein
MVSLAALLSDSISRAATPRKPPIQSTLAMKNGDFLNLTAGPPSAMVMDGRTSQSSCESGSLAAIGTGAAARSYGYGYSGPSSGCACCASL